MAKLRCGNLRSRMGLRRSLVAFLSSKCRNYRKHRSSFRGFTLIELLVVIAIIGLLVGLLLPAVQSSRESARQTTCINNLHQIALATANFHDSQGHFPAARIAPRPGDPAANNCGGNQPSWFVQLFPYIEQTAAFGQWNLFQSFSSHPTAVRSQVINSFLCPSRRSGSELVSESSSFTVGGSAGGTMPCGCPYPPIPGTTFTTYGGAHGDYAGNHGDLTPGASGAVTDFYYGGNGNGVIISSRPVCQGGVPVDWVDKIRTTDVTDGLTHTVLAGESHVALGRLLQFPDDSSLFDGESFQNSTRLGGPGAPLARGPRDTTANYLSFGSWHRERCNFAFADGSVRTIQSMIGTDLLSRLTNRQDSKINDPIY